MYIFGMFVRLQKLNYTNFLGKVRIRIRRFGDKLEKGVWGMPRLSEATKDVISCEKPRGSAHTK